MEISVEKQIENSIKWIEALLSGKYKQGKGILGDEERGFCCWGLGCKIIDINFNPLDTWNGNLYNYIGFLRSGGDIKPKYYEANDLTAMNDTTMADFKEIGKYLIKHASTNFEEKVAEGIILHFKDKI